MGDFAKTGDKGADDGVTKPVDTRYRANADPVVIAAGITAAASVYNQQQNNANRGGGSYEVGQVGTMSPEQRSAYEAMMGGSMPVRGQGMGVDPQESPEDYVARVAAFQESQAAASEATELGGFSRDEEGNITGLESDVGGIGRGTKLNEAGESVADDFSIKGLDDITTQGKLSSLIKGQEAANTSLNNAEQLYADIAKSDLEGSRQEVLKNKIEGIMSDYGADAAIGSRQLQAYGSDSLKALEKVNSGRASAIANTVAEFGLEGEKFDLGKNLQVAQGLTATGTQRGNIGIEESRMRVDLEKTQAQLEQEVNIEQSRIDQETARINAEIASGNASRIAAARAAQADLETAQRALNLDRIANVQTFENIAVEGTISGSQNYGGAGNPEMYQDARPEAPDAPDAPDAPKTQAEIDAEVEAARLEARRKARQKADEAKRDER